MSILVTGGAGYIGSVTVEALRATRESVVVLDDLSAGHREALSPDVTFYEGDVSDAPLLRNIAKRHNIEQVIHFAAFASVPESVGEPLRYFGNNTCRLVEMLRVLRPCGLRSIVFSSTAAVYGEPQSPVIDEEHQKRPCNPYGLSKYFAEQILDWSNTAYGITHVALRYFNASGALPKGAISADSPARGEDHRPEGHLIPLVLQTALGQRERVSVFGTDYPTPDGTCVRDYVHVLDLADAHIKALRYLRDGGKSQKINLGNGKGFSVREVIETARQITGRDIAVSLDARRPGDPSTLVAAHQKAAATLGWEPRYANLGDIIQTAWDWHSDHPSGYVSSSLPPPVTKSAYE
ncbi:UDP-glucose 4-epimerase GalE [Synergistales bacterium]|nr:UDP-glucose 4-epimerase GalE [Synergistales bacterium]